MQLQHIETIFGRVVKVQGSAAMKREAIGSRPQSKPSGDGYSREINFILSW